MNTLSEEEKRIKELACTMVMALETVRIHPVITKTGYYFDEKEIPWGLSADDIKLIAPEIARRVDAAGYRKIDPEISRLKEQHRRQMASVTDQNQSYVAEIDELKAKIAGLEGRIAGYEDRIKEYAEKVEWCWKAELRGMRTELKNMPRK